LQVWGSSSPDAQLVKHDVVDEQAVIVEPVLLGGSKRLFPEDALRPPHELVSTTTTATGVLNRTYRVGRG